ncbi:hypothetical protein BKA70DRAFT_1132064 [Coprinopsis sp. MPI-PUGE-AT-0042]|nr:hypothetical protein BKA70DRAFT_1132064 [Coprinopsis sp. MPI-PUGE-AT-0042]
MLWLLSSCISGSTVPAILHSGSFQPDDLDIYVPYHRWIFMKFFLLAHRDTHLVEDPTTIGKSRYQGSSPLPAVSSIWYFHNRKTNKVINVMVTSTRSPLPAIIAFHSTLVMGFITYFGIVSLYGEATTQKTGWYNGSGRLTRRDRQWMRKYSERGFSVYMNSDEAQDSLGPHICAADMNRNHTIRSLFDNGVWVHKFEGFTEDSTAELLELLAPWFIWRLQGDQCAQDSEQRPGFVTMPGEYIGF